MSMFRVIASVILLVAVCSCNRHLPEDFPVEEGVGLRPLTPTEAVADFREMTNAFRDLYGPMEFKEKRFAFSFENLVGQYEEKLQSVRTDSETFGVYAEFIARFQDGHLGIHFPANSTQASRYTIPVFITPIQEKFIVANVDESLKESGVAQGDELISVDGLTADNVLRIILKYQSFATPESNRHLIFKIFQRDFFMVDLKPTKNTASAVFLKPDGRRFTVDLVWKLEPWTNERMVEDRGGFFVPATKDLQAAAGASLMTMAKPTPFFATPEVVKEYAFQVVTAGKEYREKYGLKETDKPDVYAALYRFQGKTVLLVRNFVYYHSDFSNDVYLRMYKAILDQWERFADVLVLDQTHNGGGSYCEEFFRLFIKEEKSGFVQKLNVDRKWIVDLRLFWPQFISQANGTKLMTRIYEAMGSTVEQAYDQHLSLTDPMPIIGGRNRVAPADYTWKKPMLVLVDELAGSCGDAFPMLVKNNGVAKLFGRRTMGLGGNVEALQLSRSRANFSMTRGLFTSHRLDGKYTDDLMIENNGVEPDISYEHSVDDFRKGFVGYVKAFSEAAIAQ